MSEDLKEANKLTKAWLRLIPMPFSDDLSDCTADTQCPNERLNGLLMAYDRSGALHRSVKRLVQELFQPHFQNGFLGFPIVWLQLKKWQMKLLHEAGIVTLYDLYEKSVQELLAIKGIGPETVKDIKRCLEPLGLYLEDEDED